MPWAGQTPCFLQPLPLCEPILHPILLSDESPIAPGFQGLKPPRINQCVWHFQTSGFVDQRDHQLNKQVCPIEWIIQPNDWNWSCCANLQPRSNQRLWPISEPRLDGFAWHSKCHHAWVPVWQDNALARLQ